MSESLLELEQVSRSFVNRSGITRALDDVSVEVLRGQSLGIVGESGAGKSTILRLLLGLDNPTSGVMRFRGAPLATGSRHQLREFRKAVQIVFQDPRSSLNPRLKIASIIAEPLRSLSIPGDHHRRVREVLQWVGLDAAALNKYPAQFSGGQRQRIAIARALAPSPEVLVADEPVSALDVSVRSQIVDLLGRLKTELGMTLVLVSHDIAVVAALCEKTTVLRAGRVEEEGETISLLRSPRSDYSRKLIAAVPQMPSA